MRQPVTDDRNLIPTRPQIDIHDDFISMFNERHGETFTTRDGCKTVRIVTRETRVSQGFARIVQGQCLLPVGVPRSRSYDGAVRLRTAFTSAHGHVEAP